MIPFPRCAEQGGAASSKPHVQSACTSLADRIAPDVANRFEFGTHAAQLVFTWVYLWVFANLPGHFARRIGEQMHIFS